MGIRHVFGSWSHVPADQPELVRSQYRALATQIPLLYFILIGNTLTVVATHIDVAPPLLAVHIPALLSACCLVRLATWWFKRHGKVSEQEAARQLRMTTWLGAVFGAAFTAWGLSLFPYGDADTQVHLVFFLAVTGIGCIFCLMHLRATALMLAFMITAPLAVFLVATGRPSFMAIALNVVLVMLAMAIVLVRNYRDFTSLIVSQRELVSKNSETQRLSDENFRLANFNPLTGLPNRRRFFAELEVRLNRAKRNRQRLAVGLIDLSGFKSVNHVYGHAAGDQVLIEAGRRLLSLPGPPRFVSRLGGDEFGLIIEGDVPDAQLSTFGAAICETLRAPFVVPGMTTRLGGAVGLAAFPEAADSPGRLFERADYALYHAKQHRRGTAVLFSKEHESEIFDFSRINQELRSADLEREFSVMFQPIIDVDNRKTVGLEALARWHSPKLGMVSPAVFIPAAERSGLVTQLTEVLLRKALAASAAWPPDVYLAFNLSALDITSPEATERVIEITLASGVDPGRIEFEITETAAMRDFDQAFRALQALKRLGVRISLDDFGTGYSSLSHVHRLPLDKIKIDRSFIEEIEKDATGRDVVRTIINLCRNLNLSCVVEGTETMGQALILRSLGCRLMQGYLFSRPVRAEEVRGYLEADRHSLEDLPDNVRFLLNPAAPAGA